MAKSYRYVIDAERLSDNTIVVIKAIDVHSSELRITKMLTRFRDLDDARNHCVPLLDDFADEVDSSRHYIVMPLLRRFDDPPFYGVDEATIFIHQTLEGLADMHRRGVAHRDLAVGNIMMDASGMYPHGFHPTATDLTLDCHDYARSTRRRNVPSLRYYFIDFGISSSFEPEESHLVLGTDAQDQDVPELSLTIPYDPFLVDVFTLGNVYRRKLLSEYSNLDFLRPLVDRMIQRTPRNRPTAAQALAGFQAIMREQGGLRRRLRRCDETSATAFWLGAAEMTEPVFEVVRATLASPLLLASIIVPASLIAFLRGQTAIIPRIRSMFRHT